MRSCPNLERLDLTLCQNISNDCLMRLESACPQLLHIGAGGVESLSDEVVEAWSRLPNLRSLNVRGCRRLTDQAVATLCRDARRLETLLVTECPQVSESALLDLLRVRPGLQIGFEFSGTPLIW